MRRRRIFLTLCWLLCKVSMNECIEYLVKHISTNMKSATQPRNRFTALASKLKMSWLKRIARCYLRDSSWWQSDFDWMFAFGHDARQNKAWNVLPLIWCILFKSDLSNKCSCALIWFTEKSSEHSEFWEVSLKKKSSAQSIDRFRLDQKPPSFFSSVIKHVRALSLFSHHAVGRIW